MMILQFYKLIMATLIWCLTSGTVQADIKLGLTPLSQSADTLALAITVSGLGGGIAPAISTFDLNLQFNPDYLSYDNTVFGDPKLGDQLDVFNLGANLTSATLNAPGILEVFELSFAAPADLNAFQVASYTLAVIDFTVKQQGSSPVSISINALGDAYGNPLSANVSPVTINTVPLPAAVWLMAGGLGWVFKRKLSGMPCASQA